MRLDSSCKYTKNNANHNGEKNRGMWQRGWIPLANILKIMRITTQTLVVTCNKEVGFLLQIY